MTASRATLSGESETPALSPSPGRAPGNGALSARGPGASLYPLCSLGVGTQPRVGEMWGFSRDSGLTTLSHTTMTMCDFCAKKWIKGPLGGF